MTQSDQKHVKAVVEVGKQLGVPETKRRGGGIEPLHVSMPRELKSRPSTSPTHPGMLEFEYLAWGAFQSLASFGSALFRSLAPFRYVSNTPLIYL